MGSGFVTTAMPMSALVGFIKDISDATTRGVAKAMVEAVEIAYAEAVHRAKEQFNNTPGRTRSGQLMNAIYRGFDKTTGEGFLGVRLPYGAIQEYGGPVVPTQARHLWVKNFLGIPSTFKRMTPKEFMAARKSNPAQYPIFKNPHTGKLIAGFVGNPKAKGAGPAQMLALFTLVQKVTLPARPYIRPAVEAAYEKFGGLVDKYIAEESK